MKSSPRTYELLAKKQSLSLMRSNRKKNALVESLNQCLELEKQLKEILATTFETRNNKTVSEIKSESWYNVKIQDELSAVRNKIEFLGEELKNQKMQFAIEKEKQKKFDERFHLSKKMNRLEKEKKFESLFQNRSSIRS